MKYDTLNSFLTFLERVAPGTYETSMGYPSTITSNMFGFYDWYMASGIYKIFMNNAGDPFSDDGYLISTLSLERKTIEFFAPFYGISKDEAWGLVTSSGTDGNNHGIYFGARVLQSQTGMQPIVYVSKESHYSNRRLCDLQNLEVRLVECDPMGRMLPEALRAAIYPERPALVIFSMGSTFKGAIDDQVALNRVLEEVRPLGVYRHVDAALFGGYLPFTPYNYLVDRTTLGFDSIAVSGHKFFGLDSPCGMFITTKQVLAVQKAYKVDYLDGEMPMINCSRSALNPLKYYWVVENVGEEGFRQQAGKVLSFSDYLVEALKKIGWPVWKNEFSNTVFMRRPSEATVNKYNLARGYDEAFGGPLAHVVVMQGMKIELIDEFVAALRDELVQ